MQLSLKKIDDRIQKLQELRRIAADPELVAMLFEFIATEEDRKLPVAPPREPVAFAASPDDVSIVNQVVNGMDSKESSLWSRRKA
jgi:hypothetical protein